MQIYSWPNQRETTKEKLEQTDGLKKKKTIDRIIRRAALEFKDGMYGKVE